MSQDVLFQSQRFGMACMWGCGLMLCYDLLRLMRIWLPHRKWLYMAEEIFFWCLMVAIICSCIDRCNYGAVRNYVVVGMFVGMCLYRALFSGPIIRGTCFIIRPIAQIVEKMKKIVKYIGKRLKNKVVRVTIKHTNQKTSKTQGDRYGS